MTPEQISRKTRRAFSIAALSAAAGLAGFEWLRRSALDAGIPKPLREALGANEAFARTYFSDRTRAREFAPSLAGEPKANGSVGLETEFDSPSWSLHVDGSAELTLDDIRQLPKVEMVTELHCIEGWSQVVRWGGARFADFATKYSADKSSLGYVALTTPDEQYYVGLDMASAMHPQTLLCYEMNGLPLTSEHGAPLRLVIPVKYGIKNLKRIGTIRYSNERPADYWAERGYDWYAGL